ncbi:chlorohydrolase [Streptococcus pneumoniae]|nr:chlorohydrolase [Streptococcus pneumoniae]
MKIKEKTRKQVAGCSKHFLRLWIELTKLLKTLFEVVDRTDEVSSKHCFEVVNETDKVSNHTQGDADVV